MKKISRKSIGLKTAIIYIALIFGLPFAAKAQTKVALAGGSPAMNYSRELLKRADVQNELGLDAEQKAALAKLLGQPFGKIVVRVVKVQDLSKLSDEERNEWNREIGRQAAKQAVDTMNEQRREVEEVLTSDQRRRLTELDLQWRGILALVDKDLSTELEISPEHHSRITRILNDFEVKRILLIGNDEATESALYRKREKLLRETEQKVLAILTDEEKTRWTQATGKPFSFEK